MITENKKIEFWNFLTTEKNQPRPKGITVHRLAMLKSPILGSDELWFEIVELSGAANLSASEFYGSNKSAATESRARFWEAVRKRIGGIENRTVGTHQPVRSLKKQRPKSFSRNARRKRS